MKALPLFLAAVLAAGPLPAADPPVPPADKKPAAPAAPKKPAAAPAEKKPAPATPPAEKKPTPTPAPEPKPTPPPKEKKGAAARKEAAPEPKERGQMFQFEGVAMLEALRKVAREANVNFLVSEGVTTKHGSDRLTMMLVDVEPVQVLRIVARQKGLSLEQIENTYYLATPEERAARLTRLDDPALPLALARFKKRYLEALKAEGFNREEALRILSAEPVLPERLKAGLLELE